MRKVSPCTSQHNRTASLVAHQYRSRLRRLLTGSTLGCLVLILEFCGARACAGMQTAPPLPVNLDFESGRTPSGSPVGWSGGGAGYRVDLDTTDAHSGKACGIIEYRNAGPQGFGVFTQVVSPDAYRGKRISYTGWLKTQGVDGSAGLWMRVDGPIRTQPLAFDNMDDRPVKGTTGWKQYAITLEVPQQATAIYFGFLLAGKGALRGDDFRLEALGPATISVAATAPAPGTLTAEERAVVDDVRLRAIPLNSVSAGRGFEDLAPLDALVGNARIVALGEASHGTAEFFQMKHRLLEYLVAKKGFTVFAIEANWPESEAADRYIKTGKGSAVDALDAMGFWTWQTVEVRDMIEWMRNYNRAPGKHPLLSFTSFDMQTPDLARQHVLDYAAKLGPATRAEVSRIYGRVERLNQQTSVPLSANQKAQRVQQAASVMHWLEVRRTPLLKVSTPEEYRAAHQCARIVYQAYHEMIDGDTRDPAMAENVKWLANEAYPGQKMVLWAHNGHVSKGAFGLTKPMGEYLHKYFGDQMVVLGFASDYGQIRAVQVKQNHTVSGSPVALRLPPAAPNSVEALLQEAGMPRFVLPLRNLPANSPLGAYLAQPHLHRMIGALYDPENDLAEYVNVALPDLYDGLIFIAESHAAEPLP